MSSPRFKAVLFDLDGTLLDTLADLAAACNAALHQHGCTRLSEEEIKTYIGYGARQLIESTVRVSRPTWPDEKIDPVYRTYREIYCRDWHIKTSLYPGIAQLISDLKAAGVKLAVLSNKPHESTLEVINYYFPEETFDLCYGQLNPFPTKPDPALALHLAHLLGMAPDEVALIGDSGSDMLTAVRAKMTGIGVLWGFRDAEDLQDGGATFLAQDVAELRHLLLG